jgi:hypothetical protein
MQIMKALEINKIEDKEYNNAFINKEQKSGEYGKEPAPQSPHDFFFLFLPSTRG